MAECCGWSTCCSPSPARTPVPTVRTRATCTATTLMTFAPSGDAAGSMRQAMPPTPSRLMRATIAFWIAARALSVSSPPMTAISAGVTVIATPPEDGDPENVLPWW